MKRKTSKLVVLFAIISSSFSLCSYTRPECVTLEWHAFTSAITTATGKDAGGVGHSFLQITNGMSYTRQIGYYQLAPKETITVGLWTSGAVGSTSSSSSQNKNFSRGVLYNQEKFQYTTIEKMQDDIYTSINLNDNQINKLTTILVNKNSTYNLITYNCATFTTDVWNQLTGSSYWTGWNQTPSSVKDDIIDYQYYNGNNSLTYTSDVYFYNSDLGALELL